MSDKSNEMNAVKESYKKYADAHAPASPIFKNCIRAFWVGGLICTVAELAHTAISTYTALDEEIGALCVSVGLIFIAVLLTGLGLFDRIAKYAGAGTLVPITGFANSVASQAIDAKCEGFVLGVGAKIFTVCGPVVLYGIFTGAVVGVIELAVRCFF